MIHLMLIFYQGKIVDKSPNIEHLFGGCGPVLRFCSPVQMQSMIDDSPKVKSLQYAANEVAV